MRIAMGLQFEIIFSFRCLGQSNQAFYFKHHSTNLPLYLETGTWEFTRK